MPIQPGEPVYFLSLELQNVGAFGPEGVRIDLSDGQGRPAKWTLILGENGIGKTTALECLLGLTPVGRDAVPAGGPPIHARSWTLGGKYRQWARGHGFTFLQVTATVVPINDRVETREHGHVMYRLAGDPSGSNGFSLRFESPCEDQSEWPGKPIFSYRAGREIDFEDARFPALLLTEQTTDRKGSLLTNLPISVDGWMLAMHHTKLNWSMQSVVTDYERIVFLLIEALPGVRDIRAVPPKDRRDLFRIEYLTDDGWVPYSNLGLGYKSVMGMIGDLAYRLYIAYPDSQEPLKEAAVVLIDEIDLHLHPIWQRDLIRVLSERFPNVQFIATAHSPLMVQAAAGHNLALLYRDPETKQVRVDNDVDAIANWRLDQIVTSELFGVPSARPPKYDKEIERRDAILAQPELTEADRTEVRRIEAELGDVPLGTTEEARRMNDLLGQVLGALQTKPTE